MGADGILETFSGYSFARLSQRYPSETGIVRFLTPAFSRVQLPVQIANSFTGPGEGERTDREKIRELRRPARLGDGTTPIWIKVFGTSIVISVTLRSALRPRAIGRAETVLVAIKLTALLEHCLSPVRERSSCHACQVHTGYA